MAALRREAVVHHTVPRFLGRWVNRSRYIPLLLGFPAALLGLAILARDPIAEMLRITPLSNAEITFSYSSHFPHWLLNTFFLFFTVLALLAAIAGVRRFWRALRSSATHDGVFTPVKGLWPSIVSVMKSVITHERFSGCTSAHTRFLSHLLVFFGFLALCVVTLWVITSGVNPLAKRAFTYPFDFWSPWKILANIGGAAVLIGCIRMIYERLKDSVHVGKGKYFDWAFVMTLALVVVTGFATELLHYGRLEPHRHVIYFVHLVLAFGLLVYLPYSKFAHLLYRTTALVFAEHTGRAAETLPAIPGGREWANKPQGDRSGEEQRRAG
jgi:quinone-modifying oxidoreductase subunit QmoC